MAANASSSVAGSDSPSSNNDTKPHAILSDVVSAYKSKFKPAKANTTAPSMSDSSATATANATADGGDDYYSTPCSSDPIPSQYEAFVEVRAVLHEQHLAHASRLHCVQQSLVMPCSESRHCASVTYILNREFCALS